MFGGIRVWGLGWLYRDNGEQNGSYYLLQRILVRKNLCIQQIERPASYPTSDAGNMHRDFPNVRTQE